MLRTQGPTFPPPPGAGSTSAAVADSPAASAGPAGRGARVVRGITAATALLAIAVAAGSDLVLEGEPGFGAAQWLVLATGIAAGIVTFLPIRHAKRFLLLLGTLTLTAGAAEGAMRVLFAEWLSSLFQFHPRYIYSLKPHARTRYMHSPLNGGKSVLTVINSDGYRGPELEADPPCRIAVYGDSYVMAAFTDFEETFTERLERRLQPAVPGVEVVNAGIIGYGPDQLGLKIEDEIARLRPDLIVLTLCANDFGDLLRNKLFKLDAAGALRPNVPRITDALKRRLHDAGSDPFVLKAIAKFRRRFEPLPAPSVESDLVRARREYQGYVIEGSDVVDNAFEDHDDSDIRVDPEGEAARYKKRLMAEVLRRVKDTASKHGTTVVVLLIPAALDACDTFDGRQVDATKYPAYRRSALTDAMAEAATSAGLASVDLFPVFRAQGASPLYLHGTDDHWNAAGEDLASEHMAAYLLSRGLLRGRGSRVTARSGK